MSSLEFLVSGAGPQPRAVPFPGPRFVIGSDPSCGIQLGAKLVKPQHAEVTVDEVGTAWIRDLAGAGDVSVDGHVVREPAELFVGSMVTVGRCEMMVRAVGRTTGPSGTLATPTPLRQQPAQLGKTATPAKPSAERVDATVSRPSGAGSVAPILDETIRSTALPVGTVVAQRYRIKAKLAAGGMGEVYHVEHVELGKEMALKVMLPALSADPEFVARFKREAVAASRIGQQNIIDISDFGQTDDGRFYFVMEYLDGMTLASLVHREGAQPLERALNIMLQVSRALAAAHSKGIVHRDLKPENIMLLQRPGQADLVKVLDFGIAKVSEGKGQGGQTALGMVVGTPQYMSPEQAMAVPVDYRSDIYSLGLIFYELITGRPTFEGETPSILMVKQVTQPPPPFKPGPVNSVPNDLETLIFEMLAKAPDDRPQAMEAVVSSLESAHAIAVSMRPARTRTGDLPATVTPSKNAPGPVSAKVRALSVPPMAAKPVVAESEPELTVPKSKAPMIVLAVLVVLGLAGGAYAVMSPSEPASAPVVAPVVAAVEPAKPPPEKAPDPVPVPVPLPAVEKNVTVSFTSVPDGAEVYSDDVLQGKTPFEITKTKGFAPMEFNFVFKGFKKASKKVAFETDLKVEVALEPEKKIVIQKKKAPGELADDPYQQEEDIKPSPY